jgi:hypothetical protein
MEVLRAKARRRVLVRCRSETVKTSGIHHITAMIPLKQTTNGHILACITLQTSLKEVTNNLLGRFLILEALLCWWVGLYYLLF